MICYKNLIKWNFMSTRLLQTIKADNRPIVIITSNNEKELPEAFLEDVFHYIKFPEIDTLKKIVNVHFQK